MHSSSLVSLVSLPLLLGCPREPLTPDSTSPSVEALVDRATKDGYVVQEGAFSRASAAFCCEAEVDCLAIDSADGIGTIALPAAPDQEALDLDTYWMWGQPLPGLTRDFRLRPDEAIIWMGRTPPLASHVGFLAQVSTRAGLDGTRYRLQGALGPTLDVRSQVSGPLVVVLAPDRAVDTRVRAWLASSGFALGSVASLPFSTELAHLGLDPLADTFLVSVQALDPADPGALEAWWDDSSVQVLRFTPDGPERPAEEPWPHQPIAPRGDETDEAELEDAVTELGQALVQHFAGWLPAVGLVSPQWRDPVACLANLDCNDSWPTRLRSESPSLVLARDAVAVAFGVNHTRTGKSSVSNVSVIASRSGAGAATFDHHQMVGSARAFLGDAPRVDDLYAVVFARDCGPLGDIPCLEVPETCPGPEREDEMYLQFDDWLEPSTGAAPHEYELSLPHTAKLFPL